MRITKKAPVGLAAVAFAATALSVSPSASAIQTASGSCRDGASEMNATAWYDRTSSTSTSKWHSVMLHNHNGLGNKSNLHLESKLDVSWGSDKILKSWTSGDNIRPNVETKYSQVAGVTTPRGKQFLHAEATFDNSGPDDWCKADTTKF